MKVVIDLIEDMREEIANHQDFTLIAMLLKQHHTDSGQLIYAGEAILNSVCKDDTKQQLIFNIGGSDATLTTGALLEFLLGLSMEEMMYTLKIDANTIHGGMEVVGFGKSVEEKKYILFIEI